MTLPKLQSILQFLAVLALLTGAAFFEFLILGAPEFDRQFELRNGPYAHNVYYGFIPVIPRRWRGFEQREDEHFGLAYDFPPDTIPFSGSPGLDIGGTFNTANGESTVHAAAIWRNHILWSPLFFEGAFGGGLHDGYLIDAPEGARIMGCRFNFYESIALGVTFWNGNAISISYEHMSNADICPPNEGLSNMGVRWHSAH